uniref:Large ribosomal subunit protein uL4c n=1 Tax=Boldia erythrosiphon TaxID=74908 RepID=A0A1Y9TLV0_9RHOD|nr:50S ribosomal protein L4 [Boldia erythrosiphon]ARO90582.1 50S ribosomal protein L4 [Boldia erythrosiphon]
MVLQTTVIYNVHDLESSYQHKITLNLSIADAKAAYVVHRALVAQRTSQRQGTSSSKTRSEVRGGGRKPWKQKGTGKARVGSNRSPLWRGGGVVFGPSSDINYNKKINQKELQLALRTVLYNKYNNILVVKQFDASFNNPSTKKILSIFKIWKIDLNSKILLIVNTKNLNLYLSIRNLPNINIIAANNLNVIDLLNHNLVVITTDALLKINEVYNV